MWGLGCKVTNLRAALKRNEKQRRELGWRAASEEATIAEKDDEPAQFPAELEAVERLEFLQWFTAEEICAWINRLCAETQEASARAKALVERMGRDGRTEAHAGVVPDMDR